MANCTLISPEYGGGYFQFFRLKSKSSITLTGHS